MGIGEILAFLLGCLTGPHTGHGTEEERKRLAAALEREQADPVPRPEVVKLFRRHLPATDLTETLAANCGLDGSQERDPVPMATRLARSRPRDRE